MNPHHNREFEFAIVTFQVILDRPHNCDRQFTTGFYKLWLSKGLSIFAGNGEFNTSHGCKGSIKYSGESRSIRFKGVKGA